MSLWRGHRTRGVLLTAMWKSHRTRRAQRKWNTRLQLRTSQPTDAPVSLHRVQIRSLLSMRRSCTSSSETSGRPPVRSSPGSIWWQAMWLGRRRSTISSRSTRDRRQVNDHQRSLHGLHSRLSRCSRADTARENVDPRIRTDGLPISQSCSPRSSYALVWRKVRTAPCRDRNACAFCVSR